MATIPTSSEDRLRSVLERSRSLGFLGPQPIDIQMAHSLAFAQGLLLDDVTLNVESGELRILDLGSGGGLPGLVIQAVYANTSLILLDAMEKRVAFLKAAIADLGVSDRVGAICARAEHAAHEPSMRESFDIVVARSFGKPALTAECARGFLKPTGLLIVSEPPEEDTTRWPPSGVESLGLHDLGRRSVNAEYRDIPVTAHVRILAADGPAGQKTPRTPTALKKRPLW